ncbi:hypothetical protein MMC10_001786 [Thelotrema lepadinum]|nr:hypothetical protein [Thelotrema lepadinum]
MSSPQKSTEGATVPTAPYDPQAISYKLIYTVPPSHLSATKAAIFAVPGAGIYSGPSSSSPSSSQEILYTHVAFETKGTGHFRPTAAANPAIGEAGGEEENVEEVQVSIVCRGLECVRKAVKELKRAHPYECVAYEVLKCEVI